MGPGSAAPQPQDPETKPSAIVFPALERVVYAIGPTSGEATVITKRYSFATSEKGDLPLQLLVSSDGQITFNTKAGLPEKMETKGSLRVKAKNVEVSIPFSASYQRVEPAAVVAASVPAAPAVRTPRPSGAAVPGSPPEPASPRTQPPEPVAAVLSLDAVLAEIKSAGTSAERQTAIMKLSLIPFDQARHGDVARVLNSFLADPDRQVLTATLRALGVWGHRGNVPGLLKLLDDGDRTTRMHLIRALGPTKDARAAEAVAPLLANSQDRALAGFALRTMGPVAEDAVIQVLEHKDFFVRIEACRILGDIGGAKSIAALKKTAQEDPHNSAKTAAKLTLRRLERKASRE